MTIQERIENRIDNRFDNPRTNQKSNRQSKIESTIDLTIQERINNRKSSRKSTFAYRQHELWHGSRSIQTQWRRRVGRRIVGELYIVVKPRQPRFMIVNGTTESKISQLLYRGVRLIVRVVSRVQSAHGRHFSNRGAWRSVLLLSLLAATVRFW